MARGPEPKHTRHRRWGDTIEDAWPHLAERIAAGVTIYHACEAAGFARGTVYQWLSMHPEALEELEALKAQREEKLVTGLMDRADEDPRLALEILERRRPQDYGKQNKVEVTGKDGGPLVTVQQTRAEAWDELKQAAQSNPDVRAALIKIVRETDPDMSR